jgi:hypothetical protein
MGPISEGLFLDVPYLIDSAWRHTEYRLGAECDYQPAQRGEPGQPPRPAQIAMRPFWHKPPFWFFAITVFFVSYGPTWGGLCAIAPHDLTDLLRKAVAIAIGLGAVAFAWFRGRSEWEAIKKRLAYVQSLPPGQAIPTSRRVTVMIAIYFLLLVVAGMGVAAAIYLFGTDDRVCAVANGSVVARWRLATCLIAIALFGFITWRNANVKVDIMAQTGLLFLVGAIQWFLLAASETREAADLPYRHLFVPWAISIAAVVFFAPWIARYFLGSGGSLPERFRELLPQTELFVRRTDPDLSWRRIIYAVVYGPTYHPLHLLLLPALVALAAPAEWLNLSTFFAFLFSALLLVWGNVSTRWQQPIVYIERWFLRGTPLLISLAVIVIAILRLVRFDYVSTLLDAMPFGTVFGLVVMNYVLFWLVEYWLSRLAASELLGLLGPVQEGVRVRYTPAFPATEHTDVKVERDGRYLVSHGTGRFVVVGTISEHEPPEPAFHTYYLTELFSLLGDRTGEPADHADATEVNQRAGMYFFAMNTLLFAVAAVFLVVFLVPHYFANNGVDPVVTADAAPPQEQLVDLSSRLQLPPQPAPERPAVVIIGSGGGTRAALYTASVLNGLHRLGVDRDIVLASGVSGGGVALAYFAANSDVLTARGSSGPGKCPDKAGASRSVDAQWDCFTKAVTKPFIEDVLDGATEWRVFRTTALSVLLAESFERHLFGTQTTLGSLKGPALILNTTVVAHPDDESDALTRTIEPDKTCDGEAARPFKLMSGGRLIFTNLRDGDAFPQRAAPTSGLQGRPPIPDVRLPYQVVQGANVPLASAAALNANFPPVFPNAPVVVRGAKAGGCEQRWYYVTDGGAEENLGLISALYALESALAKVPDGTRVRPIHVVIAEASAVAYDYSQDLGISTVLGGSRERLAGGLTNALRERVDLQLQRLMGKEAAVQYHYLGLPLAFRARGGFGTHWLYAKSFDLNDPRPRTAGGVNFVPFAALSDRKAAINRQDLEQLWLALHNPDKPFCDHPPFERNPEKVRGWICGSPQNRRDLHMENWKKLRDDLLPYRTP